MDNTSRSSSPDIVGDGEDDRESSAPPSPGRNDMDVHERPVNTQSASQSGSIGSPRSPSPGLSRNSVTGSPRHSNNGSPIEVGGPIPLTTTSSSSAKTGGGGVAGAATPTNSFGNHLFNSFGVER